jgi:putative tryptophan/tyrosine transport system substrate-binding protein
MPGMRRREFVSLLGGAAAMWPLAARAQQPERVRRIGLLTGSADDAFTQARVKALLQGLKELGWVDGGNVHFDYRFAAGETSRVPAYVAELVELAPDLIIALNSPVVAAFKRATSSIPVVFVAVADPVEQGFVASLARPSGNITGFITFEPLLIGKMLEMLKEIAPDLTRAAVIFNPMTGAFIPDYLRSFEAVGLSFGVAAAPVLIHEVAEIEETIARLGRAPGSGLIVVPEAFTNLNRGSIIRLAEEHRVPAIYGYRSLVAEGGLMSFGADQIEIFRRSASYVDRILKGARPADLPVQRPVKYEIAINLKTAKGVGLVVPPSLLARADEVIE